MYQTREALLSHLRAASTERADNLTIKTYAGELTDRERAARLRIPLPALLILFMDGQPVKEVPEFQFSLLFVTDTPKAETDLSEADALQLVQDYARWLAANQSFRGTGQDNHFYHMVGLAEARAHTLMNDHKYTILELTIVVRRLN